MTSDISPADDARIFRFGRFTLDCGSRLLLRDGQPRHLTPKAYRLLYLLVTASPRALPREQLYDALWPQTFVSEANLAGIVNELRRALGDDARAAQYIRTVRGFGYAFCREVSASERQPSRSSASRYEETAAAAGET